MYDLSESTSFTAPFNNMRTLLNQWLCFMLLSVIVEYVVIIIMIDGSAECNDVFIVSWDFELQSLCAIERRRNKKY